MKKLAALLIAAALISPAFAEEAKKPEAAKAAPAGSENILSAMQNAINQANALLAEDLSEPSQQHLTRMVQQNVHRLEKIAEKSGSALEKEALMAAIRNLQALNDCVGNNWEPRELLHLGRLFRPGWVTKNCEFLKNE